MALIGTLRVNGSRSWRKYASTFNAEAIEHGFSAEYVDQCLTYAESLFGKGYPIIYSGLHFCNLVGYDEGYVYGASNSAEDYYRVFRIAKKSGGTRIISEPLPSLKEIQKWILDNILNNAPFSDPAFAFRRGRSIRDNAKFHRGQKVVVGIDLRDFFSSIKLGPVYSVFREFGYSRAVSTLLSNLCSLRGSLPQGAPTSPALSNLVFSPFDRRILGFCKSQRIRYTRYADDLTFSGNFEVGLVFSYLRKVFEGSAFRIHPDKVRVAKDGSQKKVTGIVVNEKLQAPRAFRREVRKEIFFIEKFGLEGHLRRMKMTKRNYFEHLIGKVDFVLYVDPTNKEFLKYRSFLSELRGS